VAVSVPRSPFPTAGTTPTGVTPTGSLALVSDTLHPNGTRTAYYRATGSGTATISSTVDVRTRASVPRWAGIVHIG
jgi:hypothetical protein